MVPVVTRAPNITNISCGKIAPKSLVYVNPRIILNYYTFIPGKKLRLNRAILFKFWNISKISMFILSIGTPLFEVLPLCFPKSHYSKKLLDFSIRLLIPAWGQFVTTMTSEDEFSFG